MSVGGGALMRPEHTLASTFSAGTSMPWEAPAPPPDWVKFLSGPFPPKNCIVRGEGGFPDFLYFGAHAKFQEGGWISKSFVWARVKIQNPTTTPPGRKEKSSERKKEERERNWPSIMATRSRCRTHSAQTNKSLQLVMLLLLLSTASSGWICIWTKAYINYLTFWFSTKIEDGKGNSLTLTQQL